MATTVETTSKLGKLAPKSDLRTLLLSRYVDREVLHLLFSGD